MPLTLAPIRLFLSAAILLCCGALFVRTFLLDGPLRVVSGSMAPEVQGPHFDLTCHRCGAAFALDAAAATRDGLATCPHCGDHENAIAGGRARPGDLLFADKATYAWRRPRRWEIVIVREPQGGGRWAVKRVVGLPRETIVLDGGQVFADAKPLAAPPGVEYEHPQKLHRPWSLDRPLEADEYLLLGDRSEVSLDSRQWGRGVHSREIVGRAVTFDRSERK